MELGNVESAGAIRDGAVLTFLFTDIEGSTSAWERSPQSMQQALSLHDAILDEEIKHFGGVIFKRVGDGFCAVFQLPGDAICAAVAAQRRLESGPWPDAARLRVRMGIHTGAAIAEGGDYFGPALNRVARLMAAGHGGQILVSSSSAAVLRDEKPSGYALRELGRYRLKDLSDAETIFQVVADGIPRDFPGLTTLDSRPNNLPSQISSFVGREAELRELEALAKSHRLVTIAGSGGIGKTRLLEQLAAQTIAHFKDGAWFVPLAAISDASLVVAAIVASLRLSEVPQESQEDTLLRHLAPLELLLAVDNAEHVKAGVTAAVGRILDCAPRVRILVTSREPLHVRGEQVYRLDALPEAESVHLFTDRAREVASDFAPTDAELSSIIAICRQLQGIPLALELAAARVSTLSLEQIRARLDRQLAFLTAPAAPDDDRHRTLKGTIAWSFGLLSDEERAMLGALSVFADTFTLEAVEAVAPESRKDVVDLLTSLADKSLISVRKGRESAPRYHLLEAIRSFAESESHATLKLAAREKHARFYLAIAAQGTSALPHDELAHWLNAVETDTANIRAALNFGFEQHCRELGPALSGMWRYWYLRRKLAEGRAWLQRYADAVPATDDHLPGIFRQLSAFASLQRDYERAAQFATLAQRRYEELRDEAGVLACKNALAVNEYRRGDALSAERAYREIATAHNERPNHSTVLALRNLATLKLLKSELEEATELLRRCRQYAEDLGDEEQLSTIEGLEGAVAFGRGEFEAANRHFARALDMRQNLGNDFGVAEVALGLASVDLALNKPEEAKHWIQSSLSISLKVESADLAANALETLAEVEVAAGAWETALRLFVDARVIRQAYCHAFSTKLGGHDLEERLALHFGKSIRPLVDARASVEWKVAAKAWLSQLSQPKSDDRSSRK